MAVLTPRFSANRTVQEYTEDYYLPAAARYLNALKKTRGREKNNQYLIIISEISGRT